MSSYFPLFVDVEQKKIVVVGAGRIARRRIQTLLSFGARILVIAPEAVEEIQALAEEGRLTWRKTGWGPETEAALDGSLFVLSAADDRAVNEAVYLACKARGIPVNCSDDRARCDFYFPGIAQGGGVTAGVTAGGTDHRLAREATERIRRCLTENGSET